MAKVCGRSIARPAKLVLKRQHKNLWTEEETGKVELEGYGVKVYAL